MEDEIFEVISPLLTPKPMLLPLSSFCYICSQFRSLPTTQNIFYLKMCLVFFPVQWRTPYFRNCFLMAFTLTKMFRIRSVSLRSENEHLPTG